MDGRGWLGEVDDLGEADRAFGWCKGVLLGCGSAWSLRSRQRAVFVGNVMYKLAVNVQGPRTDSSHSTSVIGSCVLRCRCPLHSDQPAHMP